MAADERRPLVTVVVPTRDRPDSLLRAVASVLDQTMGDLEVLVVDDGSREPVDLARPRVRVVRHPESRGLAAALNTGVREARGRLIAHLDDDDELLPRMLEVSLAALDRHQADGPVIVVSGVETVTEDGIVVDRRIPPTRHKGAHWSLEPLEPGRAYEVRNTMVTERSLLLDAGLFDESLRSSIRNDLFLRLNSTCTIVGLDEVTYVHRQHTGDRLSENPAGKHDSFVLLRRKHRALYRSHPSRYAHYLLVDAGRLRDAGRPVYALVRRVQAALVEPSRARAAVVRRARRLAGGPTARS